MSQKECADVGSLANQKRKVKIMNKKASIIPITMGIVLIAIGVMIKIPGNALTSYNYLNGEETSSYAMDNKYSTIDEYVGGDAYNYIIGASLVAGKTSGAMVSRAIYIASGMICLCGGLTLAALPGKGKSSDTEKDTETVIE